MKKKLFPKNVKRYKGKLFIYTNLVVFIKQETHGSPFLKWKEVMLHIHWKTSHKNKKHPYDIIQNVWKGFSIPKRSEIKKCHFKLTQLEHHYWDWEITFGK